MARAPASRDRPPETPPGSDESISRREWLLILIVVLVGAGLRLAYPSHLAVEHFDEGVYASNRWFGAPDYHYPNRHLYAPPLLSELIEWSFVLFGVSNFSAMLPSLVAGILTVPLVWWILRIWSGPRLALTAAILVAGSDLHIAFSRAALTDVLLLFWLLAAVGAGGKSFVTRSWPWAIAAGVLAGLAWWTKYNGWLSLAILGSGGVAWALFPGRPSAGTTGALAAVAKGDSSAVGESRSRRLAITIGLWLVIAGTALAVWAPYWWSLQSKGGYAAVAANHRGYFVGWSGWLRSLQYQSENLWRFGGWLTIGSSALASLLPTFLPSETGGHSTWNFRVVLQRLAVMGFLAAGMINTGLWLLICGAVAPCVILYRIARGRFPSGTPAVSLAVWIQAAWFAGMTLATPLYTPYARLVLPWWMAATLGLAALTNLFTRIAEMSAVDPAAGSSPEGELPWQARVRIMNLSVGAFGVFVLVFSARALTLNGVSGWQDRTTCQTVAKQIVTRIQEDLKLEPGSGMDQFAVYSYGEPALLFQLRLAGVGHVPPVEHLRFARPDEELAPIPTYVVLGPHAHRTSGFDKQFHVARPRLKTITGTWLRHSDLVERDNLVEQPDVAPIDKAGRERTHQVWLGPTAEAIRAGKAAPSPVVLYRILPRGGESTP